jgi:hypothetical protein
LKSDHSLSDQTRALFSRSTFTVFSFQMHQQNFITL